MSKFTEDLSSSWGMMRRREAEAKSVTKWEITTLFLLAALLADTVWLVVLSTAPAGGFSGTTYGLYLPLFIAVLPFVLGLFSPETYPESLRNRVGLAREQGWLARWDMGCVVVACVGLLLGFSHAHDQVYWPTTIIVCVLTIVSAIGLKGFKPPTFRHGGWKISAPPWLTAADQTKPEAGRPMVEPEPEANTIYGYTPSPDRDKSFRVGIHIDPETVLKPLRDWNKGRRGYLYHDDPLAVVLSRGQPAFDLGLSEIDRLSLQLMRAARNQHLTHYQFADSILRFVKAAIKQEPDDVSTQRIFSESFTEYHRFPVETLVDGVGCPVCVAILCAALLARSGFGCALLQVEIARGDIRPAIGLKLTDELFLSGRDNPFSGDPDLTKGIIADTNGDRYLYAETKAESKFGFGVIPAEWRKTFKVREIIPVSVS